MCIRQHCPAERSPLPCLAVQFDSGKINECALRLVADRDGRRLLFFDHCFSHGRIQDVSGRRLILAHIIGSCLQLERISRTVCLALECSDLLLARLVFINAEFSARQRIHRIVFRQHGIGVSLFDF